MRKNKVKWYRIPILQKNTLKNLSLSNIYEYQSIWKTILIGRVSTTEDAYNNNVCKLIETAYKNIMNGTIKFDNIDNFDKSRIKKSINHEGDYTEGSILYEKSPDTNIRIIDVMFIEVAVYGKNECAVFYGDYEQWELIKYKDKFFLIAPNEDENFSDIQNQIIADFDASLPINKIIIKAIEYIDPLKVYNNHH